MAAPRPDRRLAAILAADVAGYSALVEQDEAGTLARLAALRADLVAPLLREHRGRLVKLLGDRFLAEFASVVDAAACAVAIQDRNAGGLPLRIGINLGDVVVDGDDLYGDGVNVAARLEGLADPGGIVVSGTAWDHLHGQPGLTFASLGEQRLKNIARPVRAYRAVLASSATAPGTPAAPPPERPSLAVLPFDNLSGDPTQAYFSDGVTEDLITELSRFRDLVVLARHSSFALRGQPHDAVEIGRRLGVRYLLEGSVRRAGDRVRVTAQLIDAAAGAHLWAERYDRALDDIFAVQDELVATIAATLIGRIEAASLERARRKPTGDLAAYDFVLQGMDRLAAYGPEANAAARRLFESAIALDSGYALAHAYLALAIFNHDWGPDNDANLGRCLEHARRAVALDPSDSRCHRILGVALLFAREFDRADHHSARSLALNPNDAHAAAFRAYLLSCLGRADEAVPLIRRAIDRNPYHPGFFWNTLARVLHAAGRYEEAIAAFAQVPEFRFHHHARLAACHARVGDQAAARRCVERVLAERPGFSAAGWVATLPIRAEADRQRLTEEFLVAGLPP
jgi:adenylate cyclase